MIDKKIPGYSSRKKDRPVPKDKQLSGAEARAGRVPLQVDRKTIIYVKPNDPRLK